jgi:hypothetical protein
MDIFGLGWKFIQNVPKIDRATELARPILDKVAADQDLVPSVQKAAADLEQAWAKIKPIMDEFNKVSAELVPLLRELKETFAPSQQAKPQSTAAAAVYDIKWIQTTLIKDMGKHALPKFGDDGFYEDETRAAVWKFQEKHPECGVPDGWVGPKTAAVMEAINPPWRP